MVKFIVLILVLMTIVCSLLWFLTEDWRYERRKKYRIHKGAKMILRRAAADGIKGGILSMTVTIQSNGHFTVWNKLKLLYYCLFFGIKT